MVTGSNPVSGAICEYVGMVDESDLKSLALKRPGSSPGTRTIIKITIAQCDCKTVTWFHSILINNNFKRRYMDELKSNFKALIDNELEHEKLYSDLLDDLEIFKIRFKEELSYFSGDLKESDLEIFYENRMIKIVFDNKYIKRIKCYFT